jgi:hypothetical protein
MNHEEQLRVVIAVRNNRRISKRAVKQQTKAFDKDMKKVTKMKPTDIMSLLSELIGG